MNKSVSLWFRSQEFANKTKLIIPSAFQSFVDVSPKNSPLEPELLHSGGFLQKLIITAIPTQGQVSPRTVEINLVGTEIVNGVFPVIATLTVIIFPEVVVDIAFHFVEAPRFPETDIQENLKSTLGKTNVLKYLNDAYQQAGVCFVLSNKSGVKKVEYDSADVYGNRNKRINSSAGNDPELLAIENQANMIAPGYIPNFTTTGAQLNVLFVRGPFAKQIHYQDQDSVGNTIGVTRTKPNSMVLLKSQILILTYYAEGMDISSAIGANLAHEAGNALRLSSRQSYDPVEKKERDSYMHDWGIFPSTGLPVGQLGLVQPKGLMYFKNGTSRWLRHEDWLVANEAAKLLGKP